MSEAALRGRRVLVTGAAGFIGSHVVRRLLHVGADVHALVRPGSSARRLDALEPSIRRWDVDVADERAVLGCYRAARPEVVLHLAADTSVRRHEHGWEAVERSLAVNLRGTLNVVRGAIEADGAVSAFVRLGGLEEYGTAPFPFDEAARERPVSPYSASQVAGTHYCQMLQARAKAALVTLRPALVYGPSQSADFFIPGLIEACLRGEDFAMSDGGQRRDLLYVDDLVDAVLGAACRAGLYGAVINLGHGTEHRIRDVAREIVRLTGSRSRLLIGARTDDRGGLAHLVTSTTVAEDLLGWRPRVALRDGLLRTIDWTRARLAGAAPLRPLAEGVHR
jgi:nucleoside-diphosphate-sugar epimerase